MRRSMSFEIAPPGGKALPLTPATNDPPRRSPMHPISPEPPLVTISSPLPAMPPSTPPERPESQGALNALAGLEREELIKAVNSDNFRWKLLEDAPYQGPKQVPELETLAPDQRQHLFQTLARAVKSRREAFIDEHTHGFSDLPRDMQAEEAC